MESYLRYKDAKKISAVIHHHWGRDWGGDWAEFAKKEF